MTTDDTANEVKIDVILIIYEYNSENTNASSAEEHRLDLPIFISKDATVAELRTILESQDAVPAESENMRVNVQLTEGSDSLPDNYVIPTTVDKIVVTVIPKSLNFLLNNTPKGHTSCTPTVNKIVDAPRNKSLNYKPRQPQPAFIPGSWDYEAGSQGFDPGQVEASNHLFSQSMQGFMNLPNLNEQLPVNDHKPRSFFKKSSKNESINFMQRLQQTDADIYLPSKPNSASQSDQKKRTMSTNPLKMNNSLNQISKDPKYFDLDNAGEPSTETLPSPWALQPTARPSRLGTSIPPGSHGALPSFILDSNISINLSSHRTTDGHHDQREASVPTQEVIKNAQEPNSINDKSEASNNTQCLLDSKEKVSIDCSATNELADLNETLDINTQLSDQFSPTNSEPVPFSNNDISATASASQPCPSVSHSESNSIPFPPASVLPTKSTGSNLLPATGRFPYLYRSVFPSQHRLRSLGGRGLPHAAHIRGVIRQPEAQDQLTHSRDVPESTSSQNHKNDKNSETDDKKQETLE